MTTWLAAHALVTGGDPLRPVPGVPRPRRVPRY